VEPPTNIRPISTNGPRSVRARIALALNPADRAVAAVKNALISFGPVGMLPSVASFPDSGNATSFESSVSRMNRRRFVRSATDDDQHHLGLLTERHKAAQVRGQAQPALLDAEMAWNMPHQTARGGSTWPGRQGSAPRRRSTRRRA
jgi:hypothetical protein